MGKDKSMQEQAITQARYEFNKEELSHMSTEMANDIGEIHELKDQLGTISKDYKAKIEAKNTNVNALANKVSRKYEMREYHCYVERDHEKKIKRFIEIDSGEVIKEEEFSTEDHQMALDDK